MKKNKLSLFLEKLIAFPLWVKQIVYLRLYQDLSQYLSEDFITLEEKNIFHLYVPKLSFNGKTELFERKFGLDTNIYNFLGDVNEGLNMLEISMNNFWTMEEVAKYFIFCLEQNYVRQPDSVLVHSMAGFMSGKFRTGEYFKRAGKMDAVQLEAAILKQKELIAQGKPIKMAEVLILLGFVTEKDTTSLLLIKEEARKRFILDASIVPEEVAMLSKDAQLYQEEVDKLKQQNKLLKEQLNRILAFVKKNA